MWPLISILLIFRSRKACFLVFLWRSVFEMSVVGMRYTGIRSLCSGPPRHGPKQIAFLDGDPITARQANVGLQSLRARRNLNPAVLPHISEKLVHRKHQQKGQEQEKQKRHQRICTCTIMLKWKTPTSIQTAKHSNISSKKGKAYAFEKEDHRRGLLEATTQANHKSKSNNCNSYQDQGTLHLLAE